MSSFLIKLLCSFCEKDEAARSIKEVCNELGLSIWIDTEFFDFVEALNVGVDDLLK